ncbi:hypothetical protein FCM35_KLT03036 [Carex littledalei]|uniref:DUF4378 domain-containing protein n=1 Tax=Carex littledalei TaxID=544730 RepID=A0A833QSF7_9POAL|nr:hypothetical protein FCM35_KLT03036 [Carex littledalei]
MGLSRRGFESGAVHLDQRADQETCVGLFRLVKTGRKETIQSLLCGAMGQEMPFDKSALYDEDFVHCSCGFLQFLGFRCRISKAIHPGSYVRLSNSDSEVDTPEDATSLSVKEKDQVTKPNSYRRNIKAWIKRRINRKQNKKQKLYPGTTQLSRSNALRRSKFNQTSDSIKELGRTLLDGLLHRIPYGQKVPEDMIKEKLCRSLSADYDAYTKRGKKSGVSTNGNQDSNKFRRIHSSPASVTEKKLCDAINYVKKGEETLLNGYHEKDTKCDILELVQDNETGASVCKNRNGVDEEMFSTGEHGENTFCEPLESKEDATDSGVSCNLEFEEEEERSEKKENGCTPCETKDVSSMESTILQVAIGKKDSCIDPKDLESLTNLLKQLGFDTLLGNDEETTQIKAEEDDETPILDTEVSLEEFKRAWDQINKVEFAKFDCNILPQDLILVLDMIDQAYTEAYTNCSSRVVWFFSYVSKLSPKMTENHVLKEVQERVTWYLKAQEECSDEADDHVAWDFERYDEWLDRRADLEKIVVELERLVLDDLVKSLVVEDTEVQSLLR